MPIHKLVRHIRTTSETTRKAVAMIIAIVFGILLCIAWVMSLTNKDFNITTTDLNAIQSSDTQMVRDGLQDVVHTAQENYNRYYAIPETENINVYTTNTQNSTIDQVGAMGTQQPLFDESIPYTP